MRLPQKLQEYRQTAKLSQEDLANQLGVSRQSVSKWEQGLTFPETDKLIELSTMMGVSIDSLLKDESELLSPLQTKPTEALPGEPPSSVRRNWLTILLAGLLAVTICLLAFTLWQNRDDPASQEETSTTQSGTETTETESVPTETEPIQAAQGLENKDLMELQSWFFDFAREYRLDYMPHFTQEEGPPTDSGEYLYWAFAINMEHWGENKGVMSKSYVEETVWQYFRVVPGMHRSHRKSWDFDAETENYTAYPEGIKEKPYYLLNSIEVDQGSFTVKATCYNSQFYSLSPQEEAILLQSLLDGSNTELIPAAEVTVTFYLEFSNFHRPVFEAYTEEPIQENG